MSVTRKKGDNYEAGFTLLELMVGMAVFALIMVVAFGMMGELSRSGLENEMMGRTQASVRAASEQIEKDLRSAGVGIDYAQGQQRFVYADFYQIAFNANLEPFDDPSGYPEAINSGSAVPGDLAALHTPVLSYATGAETIIFSLDSTGDGIVGSADAADDPEEDSENPHDMVLHRKVIGFDGNANTIESSRVALVRGPEVAADGTRPDPLFTYLLDQDDDRTTAPVIHGDTDGDGELSQGEIDAAAPLTVRQMARLERVLITITGESEGSTRHSRFPQIEVQSEVMVRHQPRSSGIVFGVVYRDLDGDSVHGTGETGIEGSVIRSSSGMQTRTDSEGKYRLVLSPGVQTITQIDLAGYASTSPTTVNLDVIPGAYERLDFGDRPPSGSATVTGIVFDDRDQNGTQDAGELGVAGVNVYSDTGENTATDNAGMYSLTVPAGTRTITEVDPEGFTSTTPNTVDVTLSTGGVEIVNFGDLLLANSGTIEGYVFLDQNHNGVQDGAEGGVPGAVVHAGADSSETNFSGFYSITVTAGVHAVWETDPPGYTSTTPNRIMGVIVDPDQTVQLNFGDVVIEDVDFDVIELSSTDQALSLDSADLVEDNKADPDLVLGTRSAGGSNNVLIWHNERRNHRTPNGAIFENTPTASRSAGSDVMALSIADLGNGSGNAMILGMAGVTSNLSVWSIQNGLPQDVPMAYYATMGGDAVLDMYPRGIAGSGYTDLIVGVDRGGLRGHYEMWKGQGSGSFYREDGDVISWSADDISLVLGEVTTVEMADFNGDGYTDVAVGAIQQIDLSCVHVYLRDPLGPGLSFKGHQSIPVQGAVRDVVAVDMVDDNRGIVDLLIATEQWTTTGGVALWLQKGDGYFGLSLPGNERGMDDWMPTHGAPLVMKVTHVDNDAFPDVLVGTRYGSTFQGQLDLARGFGYLPAVPTLVNDVPLGAVVTMTVNDFNLDSASDLAIGTQDDSSSGRVIVLYRQQ